MVEEALPAGRALQEVVDATLHRQQGVVLFASLRRGAVEQQREVTIDRGRHVVGDARAGLLGELPPRRRRRRRRLGLDPAGTLGGQRGRQVRRRGRRDAAATATAFLHRVSDSNPSTAVYSASGGSSSASERITIAARKCIYSAALSYIPPLVRRAFAVATASSPKSWYPRPSDFGRTDYAFPTAAPTTP